ncbi:hypothetical protein MKZ38_006360 [Zalerion maritima]|uniref:Transmembrane protein n=1 Tax=Zalerion maritima TaxID=339359 RepID=A0AAD5WWB5_9PEZI|nr:hypothetical protein MKZ38_006360 [Zalerion maritima]
MGFVLFETTESVIEVLWDIALAFFITRLAFIYFLSFFLSGALLSYLIASQVLSVRHLTTPQSELLLVPLLVILAACWSRFLISHYEIPRVAAFRASIGLLATFMVVGAEFVTGCVLYEEGYGDWIFETDMNAGLAHGGILLMYAAMPLVMMYYEHPESLESTYHGHEKKSVVDAVPTIRSTAKEAEEKKKQ